MKSLRRLPWVVAALSVLVLSSCSRASGPRFVIGGRGSESRDIRVQVVNDNFADMGVYVMEGGTNFRLGDVTGKSSANFTLDLDRVSPGGGLRLLADPIGSRDAYLSDEVFASPGTTVVFHIAPALAQSYVILR